MHSVENRENSHWKYISSNQLFSDFFSKCVAFTKFLQKIKKSLQLHSPQHTVEIMEFYCHDFIAKIPSNQLFTKELHSKLNWRKNICVAENFSFFHTALAEKISSNQLLHTVLAINEIFRQIEAKPSTFPWNLHCKKPSFEKN